MKIIPLISALLLVHFAVQSCGAADGNAQKLCPLMIEDSIETDTFVEYEGVKVYLCCSSCKRQWRENPDYFAVVSVAQAPQLKSVAKRDIQPLKQKFCPVYPDRRVHPKGPSIIYNGKRVYFCKQRALERFQSSPGRYLKNLN